MKLTRADVTIKIAHMGGYEVTIVAEDSVTLNTPPSTRRLRFELPVGPRPIIQDLATLMRLIAEDLER